MPLTDSELVDETLAGSSAAFDRLIRRHEQLIYRIAYSYAGDVEGALDISQTVFIKVHRRLDSFHGRGTFRAWLARIAQNESLNWLQARKRRNSSVELTPMNSPSIQAIQETELLRAERTRDLRAEVHKLNQKQRQAVLLRYFENMPIREIGDVMECSEGQIKSILFRGLQVLRNRLPRQERWNKELKA